MPNKDPIILFDRPNRTYYAGETINGKVVFDHTGPSNIRKVKVYWNGFTDTYKMGELGYGPPKRYFRETIPLWKSEGGRIKFPIGKLELPFTFTLPTYCPPSFSGAFGENRYLMTVEKCYPLNVLFFGRVDASFIVQWKLELTTELKLSLSEPMSKNIRLKAGCFFMKEEYITVETTIPKLFYYPGEPTHVHLDIQNGTGVPILGFVIGLGGQAHYHSTNQEVPCKQPWNHTCPLPDRCKQMTKKRLPRHWHKEGVERYSNRVMDIEFKIPKKATPTNFATGYITFWWMLSVDLALEGGYKKCAMFPVRIGWQDGDPMVEEVEEEEQGTSEHSKEPGTSEERTRSEVHLEVPEIPEQSQGMKEPDELEEICEDLIDFTFI